MFSAADPRHTLLDLVGAPELPPEFVWHTQSIKMRGSVAKVHLLDRRQPRPADGHARDRAVDPLSRTRLRRGEVRRDVDASPIWKSRRPADVVSIHFQFAPYALRDSDWGQERARARTHRPSTPRLSTFPHLKSSIREIEIADAARPRKRPMA